MLLLYSLSVRLCKVDTLSSGHAVLQGLAPELRTLASPCSQTFTPEKLPSLALSSVRSGLSQALLPLLAHVVGGSLSAEASEMSALSSDEKQSLVVHLHTMGGLGRWLFLEAESCIQQHQGQLGSPVRFHTPDPESELGEPEVPHPPAMHR